IVAVGAMMGIVSRCVDISSGSVVALGAVAAALTFQAGLGPAPSLIAGIAACLLVYGLNGIVVGKLGLDPLIVTLAAWIWARGLAVSLTGTRTITFDQGFVSFMDTSTLACFTPDVMLMLAVYINTWLGLT